MEKKECEICGRDMVAVRDVEVYEGIVIVVYECPFCLESPENDYE